MPARWFGVINVERGSVLSYLLGPCAVPAARDILVRGMKELAFFAAHVAVGVVRLDCGRPGGRYTIAVECKRVHATGLSTRSRLNATREVGRSGP